VSAQRHESPCRLVAVDAAVVRGIADRRADVTAVLEAGEARGERGRGAAGGSAWNALHIPWVVRRPADGIEGLPVGEHSRDFRLAENDGARGKKAVDDNGVCGRARLAQRLESPRGRQPGDVEGLLDRHRDAVQRSPERAVRERAVRGASASPRPVAVEHHDRIERRVVTCDALEVEIEQLECADLACADRGGKRACGAEGQCGGHVRVNPLRCACERERGTRRACLE
jgi:hypothetical protein